LPLTAIGGTVLFIRRSESSIEVLKAVGLSVFAVSGLGLIGIIAPEHAGLIGKLIGAGIAALFAPILGGILLGALLIISLLVIFNTGLSLPAFRVPTLSLPRFGKKEEDADTDEKDDGPQEETEPEDAPEEEEEETEAEDADVRIAAPAAVNTAAGALHAFRSYGDYTPPPLSILEKDKGKPGVGDIKANANLIKRTLQNFGIQVEMDEVSIGPSVTRYALKPAEGVRLSKIVSLQTNLELALAAHPVRIEAPIPGKSLVGVEVPNSTKATVGLASLLSDKQFADAEKPLMVALGRDIAGQSHFANMAKMPHLLVAGATGSGKSVSIHALITSLLYRNSPDRLRLILIDPKRVELTLYNAIPHLLTPVITDAKKTILALKWATKEMERRYNILETESVRDIESYHTNILKAEGQRNRGTEEQEEPEPMPYIVIVIDELADIMQTYPRELEASVVRLAQMSRAVGIHLVLSTQRPSVNVITGLIKANIPARMALQVASQIDSRTILDQGGAETLLGAGDMLYLSGDMSKPRRLQTAFISETEVKKVVSFIKSHNARDLIEIDFAEAGKDPNALWNGALEESDEDDLYDEARAAVEEAGKASTSYLQRKLRIGYSRAARLMDLLEQRGVIGPADGAKPREVIGRGGTVSDEDEAAA
jgi:S-DNA-T family DNA segregation ATPase FtsK/SpoIIIE